MLDGQDAVDFLDWEHFGLAKFMPICWYSGSHGRRVNVRQRGTLAAGQCLRMLASKGIDDSVWRSVGLKPCPRFAAGRLDPTSRTEALIARSTTTSTQKVPELATFHALLRADIVDRRGNAVAPAQLRADAISRHLLPRKARNCLKVADESQCPSSDDLRPLGELRIGGSGPSGGEVRRLRRDAASAVGSGSFA